MALRIIGMMSGTSADAIDAAVVEIDGAPPKIELRVVTYLSVEYDPALRAEIFACFRPESSGVDRLCRLNAALGEAFANAALRAAEAAGLTPDQIDLIGSHGQAMWYDPPDSGGRGAVLTLGDAATIAERTGITTISEFRERDIAAGGRGAPLVSYLDWLLFRHPTKTRAIQNIGGIGNVTALPPLKRNELQPLTFDTGPGNMLIDYCVGRATDGALAYDRDGQIAARGRVDTDYLFELMAHPYLHQPPPKTTGREVFGAQLGAAIWERAIARGLAPDDIVATVTAFTVESIAAAYRDFIPYPVDEVYVAGGGSRNPTLVAMLAARLDAPLRLNDELGLSSAAKECALFALLAYEAWHNRPGALPALTGAARATVMGKLSPGRRWPPGA